MTENKGYIALIIMAVMAIVVGASLTYVGYFTTTTIRSSADSTLTPTAAVGTFTFSPNTNVSNGELVNITYGSAVYRFEFNTTGNPSTNSVLTANAIRVNASGVAGMNSNIGWKASGNLTDAINNNVTVASLVTAANTSYLTTVTFDYTGRVGNALVMDDNAVNITISDMEGGVDGASTWAEMKTNVNTAFTLMGIVLMLIGAAGLIAVLFKGFAGQAGRT